MTDALNHLNSGESLMGNRRITWFSWGDIWVDWSLEVFHVHRHVFLSTDIFTLVRIVVLPTLHYFWQSWLFGFL